MCLREIFESVCVSLRLFRPIEKEKGERERELKGCAWKHGILHGFPIGKCEVASRKSTLPPFV